MDAAERLSNVWPKLERAKQHINELHRAYRIFIKSNPYVVGTKRDDKRGLIYYIVSVKPVPIEIATITGDILQNLVSALDHLAYQLVCVGKSNEGPFFHVYFPVADSATEYEAKKVRKVEGMRPEAIEAIDEITPYKGGNDLLWKLWKLNNADKHRWVVTVGSAYRSV